MTNSSEQLEFEADRTRAQLSETLAELKERLTPGQIVDEVLEYARDGSGEFLRNLGRQARDNPLPVTLIGAGIAWMMFGGHASADGDGRKSARSFEPASDRDSSSAWSGAKGTAGEWSGRAHDIASDWSSKAQNAASGMTGRASSAVGGATESVRDTMSDASQRVKEGAHRMSDTAKQWGESASSTAQSLKSSVTDAAANAMSATTESATVVRDRTMSLAQNFVDYCTTQPLVLAGLGLAIGAAIGAMIPETETEKELMGETADQVKQQAQEIASQEMQRVKDAGSQIYERVVQETKTQADQIGSEAANSLKGEQVSSDDSAHDGEDRSEDAFANTQSQPQQDQPLIH